MHDGLPLPVVITPVLACGRPSSDGPAEGFQDPRPCWSSISLPRAPEPDAPSWQELLGER